MRIDLVKHPGRALQPFAQLLAGDCHGRQRVGVEIEISRIAERHHTGFNLGVIRWVILAATRLKWRPGRQHGQVVEIRITLDKALHVISLGLIDDLHRGIILHQ